LVNRSVFGAAATTVSLPIFLEDPKTYWWLSLVIFGGVALILDDVIYTLSNHEIIIIPR
jgi:hypothetical protein